MGSFHVQCFSHASFSVKEQEAMETSKYKPVFGSQVKELAL